jgi:hypothetical protein
MANLNGQAGFVGELLQLAQFATTVYVARDEITLDEVERIARYNRARYNRVIHEPNHPSASFRPVRRASR